LVKADDEEASTKANSRDEHVQVDQLELRVDAGAALAEARLATGGEAAGKATAKTGQAAAEEADAAAAWSAGASGLATGGEAAGVQLEPGGS